MGLLSQKSGEGGVERAMEKYLPQVCGKHTSVQVFSILVQKRQGSAGKSPAQGHKDDPGPGASPL